MARSTKLAAFPPAFLTLARAPDNIFPQSQTFSNRKAAEATRFQWYYFLRALKVNKHANEDAARRLTWTITNNIDGTATLTIATRQTGGLDQIMANLMAYEIGDSPTNINYIVPEDEEIAMREFDRLEAIRKANEAKSGATGSPTAISDDAIANFLDLKKTNTNDKS